MLAGELGLDGKVNPVSGILPLAETARESGCTLCVVPEKNYREAAAVGRIPVLAVHSLPHFLECAGKENWQGQRDRYRTDNVRAYFQTVFKNGKTKKDRVHIYKRAVWKTVHTPKDKPNTEGAEGRV